MTTKRLGIIGVVVTAVGLLLALAFWPLTSVSGAELAAARSGNEYIGYPTGSRITVRERVIDVIFANPFGTPSTTLQLDDANPDVDTSVLVRGDARGIVAPGDIVYLSAVLQTVFGASYWEVSTPADVHQSWPIDALFYGLMAAGVMVLVVAAFRRK